MKKISLFLNFTCQALADQQVILYLLRSTGVPLMTWRQQACASLSEWSLRASHLYNKHKATMKFKNSLTDEPDTPWTPTVSQLTVSLLWRGSVGVSPACSSPRGNVFWHITSISLRKSNIWDQEAREEELNDTIHNAHSAITSIWWR